MVDTGAAGEIAEDEITACKRAPDADCV